MKIRTASPRPWNLSLGGLEVQMKKTTLSLKNLGEDAEYYKFFDEYERPDILHLFSSDYSFSTIAHQAKRANIKLAVSSVYFTEYPRLLSAWVNTFDKFIWRSYFKLKQSVLLNADIVLPNCIAEMNQMNQIFSIPFKKMKVIPNGVDPEFKNYSPDLFIEKYGWSDFVLCVSRLDPRKNIDLLINAVISTDLRLVLVGPIDLSKSEYGPKLLNVIDRHKEQIKYIGQIDHDSDILKSAYAAAKIHALPSRLETPGLSNLEAGLSGCKVVTSDLATIHEYLDDFAYYCDPYSVASIRKALLTAYSSADDSSLSDHIYNNFTWDAVASKTLAAYKEISK